jgi:hypothetical protein
MKSQVPYPKHIRTVPVRTCLPFKIIIYLNNIYTL